LHRGNCVPNFSRKAEDVDGGETNNAKSDEILDLGDVESQIQGILREMRGYINSGALASI